MIWKTSKKKTARKTTATGAAAMENESVAEGMETSGATAEEQPTVDSTEDKTMKDVMQETPQEDQTMSASNAAIVLYLIKSINKSFSNFGF